MKTVLFACVHNAGRSQMAAAVFNLQAEWSKAHAISAGTEPAAAVHPEVLVAMQEIGIDLSKSVPQKLTAELAASVALVVTMGCGEACPSAPGVDRDDWVVGDPKGEPIERVREIRADIERRVRKLLADRGWLRR